MTLVDPGKSQWWHASEPYKRSCLHCGTAFITRLHNKKTCSTECRHGHRIAYGRQWRADHPTPKKWRRRVLPATLGHGPSLARNGVLIRSDLRAGDLFSWFYSACGKYNCTRSELVRAAIRYAVKGDVVITPKPKPKRARQLQIFVPVEDAIALRVEAEKHGDKSQGAVLRRVLFTLKATIDPPVSG